MDDNKLDTYKVGTTIHLYVSSIGEFEKLLIQAESEAAQLNKTLQLLRTFKINFDFAQE